MIMIRQIGRYRRMRWLVSTFASVAVAAFVLATNSAGGPHVAAEGSEIFFGVLKPTPRAGTEFAGVVAYPNDPTQVTIVKASCRGFVARRPVRGIVRRYGLRFRGGSVAAVTCGFRVPARFAGKLLTLESGCGQDCQVGGFQIMYRAPAGAFRVIFTTAAWRLRR